MLESLVSWFNSLPFVFQLWVWVLAYFGTFGIAYEINEHYHPDHDEVDNGLAALLWPLVLLMSTPFLLLKVGIWLTTRLWSGGGKALNWLMGSVAEYRHKRASRKPSNSLDGLRSFYEEESAQDERRLLDLGAKWFAKLGDLQKAREKGQAMLAQTPDDQYVASIVALLEREINAVDSRVSETYLAAESITKDRERLKKELERLTYCQEAAELLQGPEARRMQELHQEALTSAIGLKQSCGATVARISELQEAEAASMSLDPRIIGREEFRQTTVANDLWKEEVQARMGQHPARRTTTA